MALTAKFSVSIKGSHTSVLDLSTVSDPMGMEALITLTNGTGANQADLIWHDQRTLTASSSEDIDLAGALSDAFGTTLTFARMKGIYVKAASGNTNDVLIGNGGGPVALWISGTNTIAIRPGGFFMLVAPGATGYPVTATSADDIGVANSAGSTSVVYDITIIGTSA